jgi:hypothetical protein
MHHESDENSVPAYVVRITGKISAASKRIPLGSGVLIAHDLVLTCHHVCYPDGVVGSFRVFNVHVTGAAEPIAGKVIHSDADEDVDLAVLRLTTPVTGIDPPLWHHPVSEGKRVWLTGFPRSTPYKNQRAVHSADQYRILLTGDAKGGISGGTAVIAMDDSLPSPDFCIGIVRRAAKTVNTILTAVPEIEKFLRDPNVKATLPRYSPAPHLPTTRPSPQKYIDYVRKQTAFIETPARNLRQSARQMPCIAIPVPVFNRGGTHRKAPYGLVGIAVVAALPTGAVRADYDPLAR